VTIIVHEFAHIADYAERADSDHTPAFWRKWFVGLCAVIPGLTEADWPAFEARRDARLAKAGRPSKDLREYATEWSNMNAIGEAYAASRFPVSLPAMAAGVSDPSN
jgi:hypothetical protein